MQSKTIVLFLVIASILVMAQFVAGQSAPGARCRRNSSCSTRCCVNGRCADSPSWCPCNNYRECKSTEVCVPQQVQCVRAPCYPVPICQPRYLPAQPHKTNNVCH